MTGVLTGVLRVTLPAVAINSPTGYGDSMVGMSLVFFALGLKIGAEEARYLGATGLATAQRPGTELANFEEVERWVHSGQILVADVETRRPAPAHPADERLVG